MYDMKKKLKTLAIFAYFNLRVTAKTISNPVTQTSVLIKWHSKADQYGMAINQTFMFIDTVRRLF